MTPQHPNQEQNNTNNYDNNPRTNHIHAYDADDNHDNDLKPHYNDILSPFKQKRPILSGLVTSPTSMDFQDTQSLSTSEWSSTSAHSNQYYSHPESIDPHRRRNASLSVLECSNRSKLPPSAFLRRYPSLSQHHFSPIRRPSDGSSLYPFSDSDSHAASSPPLTSTTNTCNAPWQSHHSPVHVAMPLTMALPSLPAIPSEEFNPYPNVVQPQSASHSPHTLWSSTPFESQNHSLFNGHQTQSKVTNDRSADLKLSHKLSERKRRKEMKELFDELRLAIPSDDSITEKHSKSSKWETLSRAVDFLYQIQHENKILREDNKQLKAMLSNSFYKHPPSDSAPSGLVSS